MFVQGTRVLTSRGLIQFAILAYLLSSSFALIAYPIMGTIIHIMSWENLTTLTVLAVIQVMQYPTFNQLGDQAVEMAR